MYMYKQGDVSIPSGSSRKTRGLIIQTKQISNIQSCCCSIRGGYPYYFQFRTARIGGNFRSNSMEWDSIGCAGRRRIPYFWQYRVESIKAGLGVWPEGPTLECFQGFLLVFVT